MDKISVLLITEYGQEYTAPENITLTVCDCNTLPENSDFDVVIADVNAKAKVVDDILKICDVHRVFVTERMTESVSVNKFTSRKCAKTLDSAKINEFLQKEAKYYYKKPYGEKYDLSALTVSRNFNGRVTFNGNNSLELEGDFGDTLSQILYFRYNIPIEAGREIDFWIEYEKEGDIEISLEFTSYRRGHIDLVVDRTEFLEAQLEDIVTIGNFECPINLFVSIKAKGHGTLKMIALHDRYSRGKHGSFLIGGERYVASNREEIFAYFEPGDMKPPLNIYFSGYKTREGFEGYNMMKGLGSPFLLISEARLEGGAFYIGSDEYEKIMLDIINEHMERLGFTSRDIIISGLSMGSFGALYYSCDLCPHAVLLGKPLASLGDIALNEKKFRPAGFPTSLDVFKKNSEGTGTGDLETINRRLWNKYEKADWSKTKFVVAYMIEDDYDSTAYNQMISKINSSGAAVYGKGIHGRHNDNTGGIVNWFMGQFASIMAEDYLKKPGK